VLYELRRVSEIAGRAALNLTALKGGADERRRLDVCGLFTDQQ